MMNVGGGIRLRVGASPATTQKSNVTHLLRRFGTRTDEPNKKEKCLHHPGIEPRAQRWQRWILPLNQWCSMYSSVNKSVNKYYSASLE